METETIIEDDEVAVMIKRIEREVSDRNELLEFIKANAEKFRSVNDTFGFYDRTIQFSWLPHDKIIELIKSFPGKWKKEPSSQDLKVDYSLDHESGFTILAYAGTPPPSCKIVEEEVTIPETVVPEHKKTVKRLVCKE